jgi:hypothetical protein
MTRATFTIRALFALLAPIVSGRWNHVLKTFVFPPPIDLMRSTFVVNSHRQSEARQNAEYGNLRSEFGSARGNQRSENPAYTNVNVGGFWWMYYDTVVMTRTDLGGFLPMKMGESNQTVCFMRHKILKRAVMESLHAPCTI